MKYIIPICLALLVFGCANQKLKGLNFGPDVGDIAPNFEQKGIGNDSISLYDFKGRFVLVDFWASWCRPCRYENRNLKNTKLHFDKKYFPGPGNSKRKKKKGFVVLSISLDHTKSQWIKAIQTDSLYWNTHVSDLKYWNNEVGKLYRIQSIPANVLIDPNGKVVGKNLFGQKLDAKLEQFVLKEAPKN